MDRRYTAFVHLLGPHNSTLDSPLWAQDDHEPGQTTYSTDRWFPGEVVIDTFHLHIPADALPGEYALSTGFYELETMDRLSRSDVAGDTATLITIRLLEQTPSNMKGSEAAPSNMKGSEGASASPEAAP